MSWLLYPYPFQLFIHLPSYHLIVQGASLNRAILKVLWTVNYCIYLVNTYKYSVNLKAFGFPQFNSIYFPKITSVRWPTFCFRHSVSLFPKSLTTLCSISTWIHSTSSQIQCFNSWTVWGAGTLKTSDFRYP
jgi:hypothetical protein